MNIMLYANLKLHCMMIYDVSYIAICICCLQIHIVICIVKHHIKHIVYYLMCIS